MRTQVALVLTYLAATRLFELAWSYRNMRLLTPRSPRVVPHDGMAGIASVHALWLLGIAAEESLLGPTYALPAVAWGCAVLFAATEWVRFWCIRTLGLRWSVRVVVVPGADRVRRGPYQWMEHPNYVAVLVGLLALPLALGLPLVAGVCVPLAVIATRVRMRVEAAALTEAKLGPEQALNSASTSEPRD